MIIVPHNRPTLGTEEEKAAIRVIRSGWVAQGKEVESFENEFCNFLGLPANHAVALSNGTAALFMALWALNAKDKKVAFPVYACSALRNAVAMIDATDVLIDTAPDSPNINLNALKQSYAEIVIIPHMFGIPVDVSGISKMDIIEDCAQAIGARVNDIKVGLQGKVGIYSFYATKLMTSGGHGGMLVSKDKALVDAARDYREFDQRRDNKKRFNFQMTDLQAALGREQLKRLPEFLARRDGIFNKYKKAGLNLLDIDPKDYERLSPVRYRAVVRTLSPNEMIDHLARAGVKAIIPVEDWELLGESSLFPNALKLTKETVSIPIYPSLDDKDIETILSVLRKS